MPTSDDDDTKPQLPMLVEGVLGLFEAHMGYEISFRCVSRTQTAACLYCAAPTPNRLETYKNNEMLTVVIACRTCLKAAGEAARHND